MSRIGGPVSHIRAWSQVLRPEVGRHYTWPERY